MGAHDGGPETVVEPCIKLRRYPASPRSPLVLAPDPLDNDYPHYFPVTGGLRRAVSASGQRGARDAYINGRQWIPILRTSRRSRVGGVQDEG